jgi:hypothetical protein
MVPSEFHASPTAGSSGFTKTYEWVKCSFFWDGMKHDFHTFVEECDICQHNKGESVKTLETLKPLLIPPTIWTNIFMDFIVGLPKSGNKSFIIVVVDNLSKYDHLHSLQHPFTSSTVVQIFMDNIFKLHGMPHYVFLIVIQLLLAIFGKNYSGSREPNCNLVKPIIPIRMAK